jgi:hypothetical protein
MKYDPNKLFDILGARLDIKNDVSLSRALKMSPALLRKIRQRAFPIGGSILIRAHEISGLSIRELRDLMNDRRRHVRMHSPVSSSSNINRNSDGFRRFMSTRSS